MQNFTPHPRCNSLIYAIIKHIRFYLCLFSSLLFISGAVVASQQNDNLPLWEVGVGGFGFTAPDYPGSSENQTLALPFPYLIYRGDILRADREGIRGVLFESDKIEFNLSLGGNLPTDDDNQARVNMPELDPLIEIGPNLQYKVFENDKHALYAQFPIRAAISIFGEDDFIDYQGLVINPGIFSTHEFMMDKVQSRAEFTIGPLFGVDGLNNYFYDVQDIYASPERAQYHSQNGYMGLEVSADIDFLLNDNWRIFTSFDVLYLEGAKNQDSPLFEETTNFSVAIGFIYTFYQSDRRVR